MYVALISLLFALSAWLYYRGRKRARARDKLLGVCLFAATLLFFGFLSFWGELLWFEALGQLDRFLTVVYAEVGFTVLGAAIGAFIISLFTWPLRRIASATRMGAFVGGLLIGGIFGATSWEVILLYLNRTPTTLTEPILGKDVGFYLFALPFYDSVYGLLLFLALIAVAAAIVAPFERGAKVARLTIEVEVEDTPAHGPTTEDRALFIAAGVLALVLALGRILAAYHLLYSSWGAVYGPGWTDVHIRLPAFYIVAAVTALVGLALFSRRIVRKLYAFGAARGRARTVPAFALGAPALLVIVVWTLALWVVPFLFQWLKVSPNEISLEMPYIANNIRFTRQGFALSDIKDEEFPVSGELSQKTIENNRGVLSEIRLWDPKAIDAVYEQFQEIRLYYEIPHVDIDRYTIGGAYRQVMISPRELSVNNLPPESRTFVNLHFKYTHGYGLVMSPVSEFTAEGLPELYIKDLPPVSSYPELAVTRPQIYYGEETDTYVVVNTKEAEFDYPKGGENVYIRYPGRGGVQLDGTFRRFLYGFKLGGTKLFFSSYPTDESRIMFRRNVRARAHALAPFLAFDRDPYLVLADGRLYWIIDAYTTSPNYPYSAPFFSSAAEGASPFLRAQRGVADYLHGKNYVRNSVKVVVDAFEGSVDFYVFDPDDPIIQVYWRIFPSLFKDRRDMPASLYAHARYPEGFLLAQGLVYTRYHMTDPEVFYNQEDLWVPATEKYYDELRPVEPYYVMWKPQGASGPEFTLIQPFTPKNRQVLVGWIAGLSDGASYGDIVAYHFPKYQWVLGTQQVDTKIDQDPYLSAQLTLWDQRGSKVIRGNVLAIPIDDLILYVEPIYIQAEAAAYPELRVVVVMHQDRMSYAASFEEALLGLLKGGEAKAFVAEPREAPMEELVRQASAAFNAYLEDMGKGRFDEAARQLSTLKEALSKLGGEAPRSESTHPSQPGRAGAQ